MCGIAGFTRTDSTRYPAEEVLDNMGNAILHRGPDASGNYVDDDVALRHQRLSIIDLSETGHQPMFSNDERYVTVYNGEIYNFPELREELQRDGHQFRGQSDTEVLLALYERIGKAVLDRINGFYALAIWDRVEKTLFLARDRLGKKPLYYSFNNGQLVFASEIKAILQVPGMQREIDKEALVDFFHYQYVPDTKCIFSNMEKLPAGHWMELKNGKLEVRQYWDISFAGKTAKSEEEITSTLLKNLDQSVQSRMVSDVPLGAFLSGGVDSSAIVGLMANASNEPIKTCSIGFDEERFNELEHSKKIAEQFGTNHKEYIARQNLEQDFLKITGFFDEPFADASLIPTYYVSELARKTVTVAISGDGGDENFAGYSKYLTDYRENRIRNKIPAVLRRSVLKSLAEMIGRPNNSVLRKANSLLSTLAAEPDYAFFTTNCFFNADLWQKIINDDLRGAVDGYDPSEYTRQYYRSADTDDHLQKLLYTDIKTYLVGDILVKVDRMSMANSLETRAPLLDYKLMEYVATIPANLKLRDNETKYILKKSLEKLLPDDILYRKKMGFSIPLAEWLTNEFNNLFEDTVLASDSGISNYFDTDMIKNTWQAHLAGNHNHSDELWSMLIFETWWRNYAA